MPWFLKSEFEELQAAFTQDIAATAANDEDAMDTAKARVTAGAVEIDRIVALYMHEMPKTREQLDFALLMEMQALRSYSAVQIVSVLPSSRYTSNSHRIASTLYKILLINSTSSTVCVIRFRLKEARVSVLVRVD